ncbi:MAG: peptidase T [Anaerolineaceae bacterium]
MSTVIERFLRYVKVDTQSDVNSESHPSTEKQITLSKIMAEELKTLGLEDIKIDQYGNVTATLPSNLDHLVPVMGLLAHLDTATEMSGANVNPRLIENYDGGDITLDLKSKIILSPREFPELKKYIGKTLITTDGTTLLGADDKAGVAEIMTALELLISHPEIPHGKLRIAFTTDEETGKGIKFFDIEQFAADYAYTVDGGELGELEYENFNAAKATVQIQGRSVHPGDAKNKMINASLVAMEYDALLPPDERPAYTEKYEGFFHLEKLSGEVDKATLKYLVRDHDAMKFKSRCDLIKRSAEWLNQRYGTGTVTVALEDQYTNMREKIEPVIWVVDQAREAMQAVGVTSLVKAIRGGTDGAQLSWKGLPTPNLFTGGMNYHGKYECIPTSAMEKAVEVLVKLVELSSQRK